MKEKLLERFKKALYKFKVVKDMVNERVLETRRAELEDATWRRISQTTRPRDLPEIKQDRMIQIVDWLEERNPQARKILNLYTDFVVGDGITFKANDPKVQEQLEKFWRVNEWDLKLFTRMKDLSKYGEQIYMPFMNKASGIIKLGVMDPEQVNKVERNKDNAEELDNILPKKRFGGSPTKKDRIPIIKFDYKQDKFKDGEAFFFQVNNSVHSTRGKSDILCLLDWLDMYDKTLYTMTERVSFLLSFIWDIKVDGASEPELRAKLADLEMHKPKPGSFRVHNEKETWDTVSPDLRGDDFTNFFNWPRSQLTSGSNVPLHWLFGIAEDINKASSKEITEPIYRQLKRRQDFIKNMFETMFKYQIEKLLSVGELKGVKDFEFTIQMSDASRKDAEMVSETYKTMTDAFTIGVQNEFVSQQTATQTLTMILNQIGINTDPKKEEENIEKESINEPLANAMSKVAKAVNKKNEKDEEKEVAGTDGETETGKEEGGKRTVPPGKK